MDRHQKIGVVLLAVGVLASTVVALGTARNVQDYDCGRSGPTPWPPGKLLWAEADNPGPGTHVPEGNDLATRYDAENHTSSIMVSCDSASGPTCCVTEFRLRVEGDQRDIGWKEHFMVRDTEHGRDSLVPDPTWNATQARFGLQGLMTQHVYRIVSPVPYIGGVALAMTALASGTVLAWTRLARGAVMSAVTAFLGAFLASTGFTMFILVWMWGFFWFPLAAVGLAVGAAFAHDLRWRVALAVWSCFFLSTLLASLWLALGFGIGIG